MGIGAVLLETVAGAMRPINRDRKGGGEPSHLELEVSVKRRFSMSWLNVCSAIRLEVSTARLSGDTVALIPCQRTREGFTAGVPESVPGCRYGVFARQNVWRSGACGCRRGLFAMTLRRVVLAWAEMTDVFWRPPFVAASGLVLRVMVSGITRLSCVTGACPGSFRLCWDGAVQGAMRGSSPCGSGALLFSRGSSPGMFGRNSD